MLHLIQLRHRLGGAHKPGVGRDIMDQLAIDPDLPAVVQRFEECLASPDPHQTRFPVHSNSKQIAAPCRLRDTGEVVFISTVSSRRAPAGSGDSATSPYPDQARSEVITFKQQ